MRAALPAGSRKLSVKCPSCRSAERHTFNGRIGKSSSGEPTIELRCACGRTWASRSDHAFKEYAPDHRSQR